MRRFIVNIALTLWASVLMAALAQSPSAEVSLPRNPVAGERFSLTVTVNNPDGNITPPAAPELDGCTLLGGPGVSTSSYTSIVNGHMQSTNSTAYSFTYLADREGSVKVPSITVKVSGKTLSTAPGSFSVLKRSERQQQQQQQGYGTGGRGRQHEQQGAAGDFHTGSNELFIRMELSASSAYENQAVECVTKIYSIDARIRSVSASSVASFDGCLIESLSTPSNIEWNREHFNGENYYTAVIARSLLYPQRPGDLTLGGGEYTINVYREMIVQDFPFPRRVMDDKDVTVKPRSATLHVNALPSPQPAGFSGAVGRFSAETRLVGNTFKTNEAATLLYTISGTGNIKYLKEPSLDLPSEFELYDPHVENTAHVSGRNMTGTMTVDYTFVPQSVGNFHIGASDFVYFDPSKREYVTVNLPSYDIDVAQGANVSSTAVAFHDKRDIEAKNTDIHFIKPGASAPSHPEKYMADTLWFWLLFPIGVTLFATAMIMMRRSLAARSDVKTQRLNKAGKVARRRLAAASKALKHKHYDAFYEELLRALQGYLGDKLQLSGSQLNRDNITAALLAAGADTEMTGSLVEVLNECEMARYTPQLSPEQADRTYSQANGLINSIESLKHK